MSSEDLLGEIKHHNHINSALAQLDNLEDGTTSIQQLQGPASTVPPGDYEGKAFALLDKNNDGVIDHEEWRQAEVVSTWFSSGQDVRPQSQKDIQRIEAREPIALSRTPTAHLTE